MKFNSFMFFIAILLMLLIENTFGIEVKNSSELKKNGSDILMTEIKILEETIILYKQKIEFLKKIRNNYLEKNEKIPVNLKR